MCPTERSVVPIPRVNEGDGESLVAILFPGPTLLSLVGLFAVVPIIDGGDCCRGTRGNL
jgi:hypothetical protein